MKFSELFSPLLTGDLHRVDGAVLVQRVPHVGPQAFLHALYEPLTREDLSKLEQSVRTKLPAGLRRFYRVHNGCDLFSGALSLFGLRRRTGRDLRAAWQPFDLATPNLEERPPGAAVGAVFFGAYDGDGSLLFMRSGPSVHRCARDSAVVLNTWSSLEVFVASELRRLEKLFTRDGRRKRRVAATTPGRAPKAFP